MTKKKVARKFAVRASIDNLSLAKAGSSLKLIIDAKGEKLGELQIGRGSLFWWGANRKTRERIPWGRLAELLNEIAYGKK
jgi:hypothetical protein